MSNAIAMVDAVFDVSGELLPVDYQFILWQALIARVPELAAEDTVGMLPLRTAPTDGGVLLPKRAKLVLRLPQSLFVHAEALSGLQLEIAGHALQFGTVRQRQIQPYPTLHAHLVVADDDEVQFLSYVATLLERLGVDGKLICGMRNVLRCADRTIQGYSLVIHDLKPEASLRLQYAGLGADRNYGCGVFVPYKAITDLE